MQQQTVQQTFTIPHSKDEVINGIKALVVNTGNTYMNYKINEDFGTVEFTIVNKVVYSFKAFLALTSLSENQTEVKVTLSKLQGSSVSEANMLSSFGDFSNLLSRKLKGENLSAADIKKVGGGCMFIALLGIGISVFYMFIHFLN